MNRTIFAALLFLCFIFISALSSWGVDIDHHTMTLNPSTGDSCEYPLPEYTFDDSQESAFSWFDYTNGTIGDEIRWEWYDPSGDFYTEATITYAYESGCYWHGIFINGYPPALLPGDWRVDVYFDNEGHYFSEYFSIEGTITSTTTTQFPDLCFLSQIYGEHSEAVQFLRQFRDTILSQTQKGQELIKLYYQWSPVIARAVEQDEEFRQTVKDMVDGILDMIE